jgi:hypothetical protein
MFPNRLVSISCWQFHGMTKNKESCHSHVLILGAIVLSTIVDANYPSSKRKADEKREKEDNGQLRYLALMSINVYLRTLPSPVSIL